MLLFNPIITLRQRQVIRGTILGGSSIIKPKKGRGCYLSMRNCNYNWIEFKARELAILASHTPFTHDITHRWHSMCYPVFKEFLEEFYENGKRKLEVASLDPLQDIGLAVWFRDCGKVKDGEIILNMNIWGSEGSHHCHEYFLLLGYSPMTYKEGNYWRIKLDKQSSKDCLKMIAHHLPDSI